MLYCAFFGHKKLQKKMVTHEKLCSKNDFNSSRILQISDIYSKSISVRLSKDIPWTFRNVLKALGSLS